MDWNILVPLISLIALIVQPLCSLAINKQNLKDRQIERKYENEVLIYRNFADSYGAMKYSPDAKNLNNFLGFAYQVSLVCKDKKVQKLMFQLAALLKENPIANSQVADALFQESVSLLSKCV